MTQQETIHIHLGEQSYDIVIGSGVLTNAYEHLEPVLKSKRVGIVTDENVARVHLFDFARNLVDAGLEVAKPIVLPPGERTKSFDGLETLTGMCLDHGLDRHSTVIALGGGVIGDITGFAASMVMRGIQFIQVPTTLLAQVDSSVGGKTGINTPQGKNLVGAFYQPAKVLIDTKVLTTLPKRQLMAGYAEVLKYALINKPEFFEWLDRHYAGVIDCDAEALQKVVSISCKAKAEIVEQDQKEQTGVRALLNLGHTFGHALEAFRGYDGSCLHGEAVGIGMILAFELSAELGLCSQADADRVRSHIEDLGMMTVPPFRITGDEMFELMRGDKKNTGGEMNLILVKGIGKAFLAKNFDQEALKAFLHKKFG